MKSRQVVYKKHVGRRMLATLIDYTLYGIFFCVYVCFVGEPNSEGGREVHGTLALPLIIVWFLYFVVSEADICKLIVVGTQGDRVTLSKAFKRRIVDPIDLFLYGIPAFICIYNTPKFQRPGDLLADTVVVKKSDIIEEMQKLHND
jgi:uncharacterized RDD family membrane protein YckC